MMTTPRDPLAAVMHPDPYAYYADLVARAPCYRDERLGLWIVTSADAVLAALTSDMCRVRPPTEPVPQALLGSPAGAIFRRLVRMNDGDAHDGAKRAVSATLATLSHADMVAESESWARWLVQRRMPHRDPRQITRIAFDLPVYVVASLLGVPRDQLPQVATWMADFVRCLAPGSDAELVARGIAASGCLFELFHALVAKAEGEGLLMRLAREARQAGLEDSETIVANGIGFISQAYEATAGLIGNTLLALAVHREAREQVMAEPGLLGAAVQETLRYDAPVQNTRRFLAHDGWVAGHEMRAGDTILVVLAAANRDPAANPSPERFDLFRDDRQSFTFGIGAHACAGAQLAATIAEAGVKELIGVGCMDASLAATVTYRASANTRIPLWMWEEGGAHEERRDYDHDCGDL